MSREERIEAGLIRPAYYHLRSWGIEGYYPSIRERLINRGQVTPQAQRKTK